MPKRRKPHAVEVEEYLDCTSPEDAFIKIIAAMVEAVDSPKDSFEHQTLERMMKLAMRVYQEHFAVAESKYALSLFICCLTEIQVENFCTKGELIQ